MLSPFILGYYQKKKQKKTDSLKDGSRNFLQDFNQLLLYCVTIFMLKIKRVSVTQKIYY